MAVERLRDSSLKSKPVAVCSRHSPRSLIYSASPEARKEGVFEGQPLTQALQNCRRLVVLPPDPKLYQDASQEIISQLSVFSPLIEPRHWGRFFIDMTGSERLFGEIHDTAAQMRQAVSDTLRLSSALGIASNKLVSGVASKFVIAQNELYEVPSGSEASFLAPLKVRMLPSVGSKVERELLDEFNIHYVSQLADMSLMQLASVFGKRGKTLYKQARGIDDRPVLPPSTKSLVFEEITLEEDTNDDGILSGLFYGLMENACHRMRKKNVLPKTVWLHLRYSDGMDITRRMKLINPVLADPLLFQKLEPFFIKSNFRRQRIRYIGLTFTDLFYPPDQLSFFDSFTAPTREDKLVDALDEIRKKYGQSAVAWGRTLNLSC